MEHGQADGPEYCFAHGADRLAVAKSGFEDVAAFITDLAIGVLLGERLAVLKEGFLLIVEVEEGFAFGSGAVGLCEFDLRGRGGRLDGFAGVFGCGATFAAVAGLVLVV